MVAAEGLSRLSFARQEVVGDAFGFLKTGRHAARGYATERDRPFAFLGAGSRPVQKAGGTLARRRPAPGRRQSALRSAC